MNYCEKHKQRYMTELCPICLGERMIDYTHSEAPDVHKKAIEDIKNDKVKK